MLKQNTIIDDQVTELMKGYRAKQVCAVDKSTFIIMGEWILPDDDRLLDPPYPSVIISITIHLNFVSSVIYKDGLNSFFYADGGYPNGNKRGLAADTGGTVTFYSYNPDMPNGTESRDYSLFRGISDVKLIGNHFYILCSNVGIFKRTAVGQWEVIGKKLKESDSQNPKATINTIDGFSEKDIYTGGNDGSLWHFNGVKWKQLDPPTNWKMRHLVCAKDGKVYITGRHGQLLAGRNDNWEELISMDESDEHGVYELYSMAWFQGKLYIANGSKVFYLDKKEWKVADYIKNIGNVEKIHANDDVMIIGASHRVTFYNGENEEILYENTDWLKAQVVGSSLLNIGTGMIEEGNKLIDLLNEGK